MDEFFKLSNLKTFYKLYAKTTLFLPNTYKIDTPLKADHLGCLVHDSKEFDRISEIIKTYATLIKEVALHNRRVRIFKLNKVLLGVYPLQKLEIFEPKPESDFSKLRFGVEHIAFTLNDYEKNSKKIKDKIPIVKEGVVDNSKFMKTEVLNSIEIEFRNDYLGEEK